MAHAEASARTVEAAVAAAAAKLGLHTDQVDVEVLEEAVPSTFGYIGSPARVRVTARIPTAAAAMAQGSGSAADAAQRSDPTADAARTPGSTGAAAGSPGPAAAVAQGSGSIGDAAGSPGPTAAMAQTSGPSGSDPTWDRGPAGPDMTPGSPPSRPDPARTSQSPGFEPTGPAPTMRVDPPWPTPASRVDPEGVQGSAGAGGELSSPFEPAGTRAPGTAEPADRRASGTAERAGMEVPPGRVHGPDGSSRVQAPPGPGHVGWPPVATPEEGSGVPAATSVAGGERARPGPASESLEASGPEAGRPEQGGAPPHLPERAVDMPATAGPAGSDLPGKATPGAAADALDRPSSPVFPVPAAPQGRAPTAGAAAGTAHSTPSLGVPGPTDRLSPSTAAAPADADDATGGATEVRPRADTWSEDAPSAAAMDGSTTPPTRPSREHGEEPIDPAAVEHDTERAGDFLEGLLDALDVDGDITTWVDDTGGHVDLEGSGLDILVGPNGETLDALQDLTRLAVLRQSRRRARLFLDINGFRARQRERLVSLAKATVEQVIETGEDHELQPMTPAERKVVHDVVAAIEGAETESLGEEPNRRVVIRPTQRFT